MWVYIYSVLIMSIIVVDTITYKEPITHEETKQQDTLSNQTTNNLYE